MVSGGAGCWARGRCALTLCSLERLLWGGGSGGRAALLSRFLFWSWVCSDQTKFSDAPEGQMFSNWEKREQGGWGMALRKWVRTLHSKRSEAAATVKKSNLQWGRRGCLIKLLFLIPLFSVFLPLCFLLVFLRSHRHSCTAQLSEIFSFLFF